MMVHFTQLGYNRVTLDAPIHQPTYDELLRALAPFFSSDIFIVDFAIDPATNTGTVFSRNPHDHSEGRKRSFGKFTLSGDFPHPIPV